MAVARHRRPHLTPPLIHFKFLDPGVAVESSPAGVASLVHLALHEGGSGGSGGRGLLSHAAVKRTRICQPC